jgi:hypothetical protein
MVTADSAPTVITQIGCITVISARAIAERKRPFRYFPRADFSHRGNYAARHYRLNIMTERLEHALNVRETKSRKQITVRPGSMIGKLLRRSAPPASRKKEAAAQNAQIPASWFCFDAPNSVKRILSINRTHHSRRRGKPPRAA